ncbi:cytochrome P450 [Fomitopsis serialis]|uniref:cytochrome P450 n=1 Tax=Fomitopsis serialis TaxID=139415 RepID=UPI002008A26D|nr:cytochrome P450 [Neoantrodia serialis]KAH9915853.1 cytochrome P450 [Neoantrodia serialis]
MTSLSTHLSAGLALALFVGCLLYPTYSVGTRRRKDLPGPTGLPLIGNLIQFFSVRTAVLLYLSSLQKHYGELYSFTMPGWGRNIVVNRPEWLEHIRKHDGSIYGKGDLVLSIFAEFPGSSSAFGSEGQEWRLSRKLMKPIFATRTFSSDVSHAMHEIVPLARELLSHASKQNRLIDFNGGSSHFCGRLALVMFCKMSLDYDTDLLTADPECLAKPHSMVGAVTALSSISSGRLYNPFWRFTEKFDGLGEHFRASRQECYGVIDRIVKQRQEEFARDGADKHQDFLGALLREKTAQDPITLRDTLVTLLFAGRDNVQNVLAWSLHELSCFPGWLDQMRNESHSVQRDTSPVRYEELQNYPVHLAVFYETLRLWPGVPKNARIALKDDVIPALPDGGHGPIVVDKGDYILWSDYAMMRNEKVWGIDANSFNPGRHLDAEGRFTKPPAPKFHAFGYGSRVCPGGQLAAYEFVCVWTGILRFYDIIPEKIEERLPSDALTMNMKDPFWVRIGVRECGMEA